MKTVFKRLVSSMLLVVMLVAAVPASLVSASDVIDWDALQEKYGLTDEQIEKAKDIAEEFELTQEQVDAIEEYWADLSEEEKQEIKDAVQNDELDKDDYAVAIAGAVLKSAVKDIVDRVLAELEGITVDNPFDLNRVYDENGSLESVDFVLQATEETDILDLINGIAKKYDVYGALASMIPALLTVDKLSINGYDIYDLADPSTVWNALVDVYNANPIAFTTIANMKGNVLAEYNIVLSYGKTTLELPVRFVINCSDKTLDRIKAVAAELAENVEINGSFDAENGIYSAEIEAIVDVSDYLDEILEYVLPSMVADDYSTIREKLHAMTVRDLLDQITLENMQTAAAKLGYEAQFNKLVNAIAAYFHLDTAEPNNIDALIAVLDKNRYFQVYAKARLQKLYGVLNGDEILNTTVGALYNGDGSYSCVLGDGIGPVGFDAYLDRVIDRLLNSKIEEKLSKALAILGYSDVAHYVDAIKNKYHNIYTGKYDLDLYLTVILFDVYTVTFVDEEGNVIEVQQVVAGDGATDPDWHGGWDYYDYDVDYDIVMSDLEVTLYPIHELDGGTVTKYPTCQEKGEIEYSCTIDGCDYTETKSIPVDDHYMLLLDHVEPTCDSQGYTIYVCGYMCGHIVIEHTDALGHTWDDGVVTKAPTHMEAGEITYTCSVCGETKTEDIPPLGDHTYVSEYTDPSCCDDGYWTHTCECGASYIETDTGSALGHDYKNVETLAPTCTEPGYIEQVCDRCADHFVVEELAPLGHTWDGGVITKEPSCCEEGEILYTCLVCGETYTETLPILADAHVWDDGVVTVMPNCTDIGVKMYTCTVCGEEKLEEIPALGHAWDLDNGEYYSATCDTDAYYVFTCSACGETETVYAFGTAGHIFDYTNGEYVAPTCASEGSWTYYCVGAGCDATHVIIIDKLEDHTWADAELTLAPTCTEDGELTYVCDVCGETKTETVPSNGEHVWTDVHVDGTNCCDPTVDKKVCAVCGEETDVVTTPVYVPTLKEEAEDLHFISNILIVSTNKLTVEEFKTMFNTSVTVYNKNGDEMKDTAYVGTECTFVCEGCDTTFTIAVIGDINGDGKLNAVDYVLSKRQVMRTLELEGAQLAAADVNVDCRINVLDYALLKGHVMFLYNIYDKTPDWDEVEFLIVKFEAPVKG